MRGSYCLLVSLLLFVQTTFHGKTINPLQYGLNEAKNGLERFEALMRCHEDAIMQNAHISYSGISVIDLEIPYKAKSIPLPEYTDFAGVRINVYNHDRDYVLFRMTQDISEITVTGAGIDNGDFRSDIVLRDGLKLLILEDQNLWVTKRLGYKSSTGYKRKDILVLNNGKAQNQTVQPYNNAYSSPKGWYCDVSPKKKVVKNLDFHRTENSTVKTYPIAINYQYNVELSNISMTTPQNTDIVDDCGIMIYDSAKIKMSNVCINGTYSTEKNSGSGVRLINVYNIKINRMYARCKWGVFGNYYVNKAILNDCDINRFDIHCYGRDIKSFNCTFRDLYNQFSSIYGFVKFKNCNFINATPVLIESSYNAFTPFDIIWDNCLFHLSKDKNYLITLMGVPKQYNERPELRRKALPNITMRDCKVYIEDDIESWNIVRTHGLFYPDTFDYIDKVSITRVKVFCKREKPFSLFSEDIRTSNSVKKITNIESIKLK